MGLLMNHPGNTTCSVAIRSCEATPRPESYREDVELVDDEGLAGAAAASTSTGGRSGETLSYSPSEAPSTDGVRQRLNLNV